MNLNTQTSKALTFLMAAMLYSFFAQAETAFTYQGQLSQTGQPANGQYDMNFTLFDALTAGQAVGTTLAETDITVTDGVFDVLLDFGDAPFNNASRWLEIEVREAGGGVFTTLTPRQRVGASPFAIETLFVAPGAVDTAAIQNGAVTEDKLADESVILGKLATGSVTSGAILNNQVSSVDIANGSIQRADLQDNLIGTNQIEDGSVASTDIRDGTITALDVAGGLYSNKNDLYEVFSPLVTLLTLPQTTTAACLDNNDLPVWGGCRKESGVDYHSLHGQQSDWTNAAAPASVECYGRNAHPSNPSGNPVVIQAHMICLTVD